MQLRVGVIGLGIGRNHVPRFNEHPSAKVVAVTDIDTERLAANAVELDATPYGDHREMLARENLDVVSVAVPNSLHKSITLDAVAAGAHVLCEKPMAMNANEGREMLRAAQDAEKRLMIDFSFRFTPQSWALKHQVDSGVLGEIYFGRSVWHRRRGMPRFGGWFGKKALSGGGPLIDLGVHRLDLALWLMGYPKPIWVCGSTYDLIATAHAAHAGVEFDVEDLAAAFIRFEGGATLILEASWAGHIAEKELMETRLLGTQAGLLQRNRNEGYEFEATLFTDRDGYPFDMKLHDTLAMPSPPSAMYHFVDAILNDTPHTATGEEGIIVMEILDAIYESAGTGRPVEITRV